MIACSDCDLHLLRPTSIQTSLTRLTTATSNYANSSR